MGIPGSGNISIKSAAGSGRSIDAENTAVSSGSLVSLSTSAIEGLSTLNESPYAMSEFYNYTHRFSTTFTFGTQTGGKGGSVVRYTMTPAAQAILSDGNSYSFDCKTSLGTTDGFRVRFFGSLSSFPNHWESITVESSSITNFTLARSVFTETTVGTNKQYHLDNSTNYIVGSGSGTLYFNFE